MPDGVKPRRRYDSSRRQEQARENRRAVLAAARRMFLEQGYAATTVGAIASEAGVSVETVYKAFGNKPGLVKAVADVAIVGDDEPVPMLQRERVRRIQAEPDPRRKLAMYGEHLAESAPRRVPVELLVRAAAASDPGATGCGKSWRRSGWWAWRCLLATWTREATCSRAYRRMRPATCCGLTTPRSSTTCWSYGADGARRATAAGWPTPWLLHCCRESS